MANLIPSPHIKTYYRDMLMRVIIAASIGMTACAGIIILGLLPAYFDIRIEHEGRSLVLETISQPQKSENASEREVIAQVRRRMTALDTLGKEQDFGAALEAAIKERPKGMLVRSVMYTHKDGAGSITIAGVVPDSSAVKTYAEALKAISLFKKVTVPLTALAHTEGGTFSISADGTF